MASAAEAKKCPRLSQCRTLSVSISRRYASWTSAVACSVGPATSVRRRLNVLGLARGFVFSRKLFCGGLSNFCQFGSPQNAVGRYDRPQLRKPRFLAQECATEAG